MAEPSSKYNAKQGQKERYNTKYIKDASNSKRPLMKHEEGVKIRPFIVRTRAQKQKHKRLTNHAKTEPKERYKSKWQMEASNSDEHFKNV